MDQTTSHFTSSEYDGEICEELRIPQQHYFTDDIQLQTNSCYQISSTNFQRAEWDKAESNYTAHRANQMQYTHADVGLRRSKRAYQVHIRIKS